MSENFKQAYENLNREYTEIAKQARVSKHKIQRLRKSLHINSLPSQTRFKKGDPHSRWSKKERRLPADGN